jgi:copper chaperone CopZ
MATQHFKLESLSCPSCVMHLEAMEDKEGIVKVDASFKRQTMKVEYDEAIQTPSNIVKFVSEMGYVAIPNEKTDNNKKEGSRWTKYFRS